MTATMERRVSNPKGGRPRRDEQTQGSRQVRIYDDLGAMLSWVCEVQQSTTAAFLDPILRPVVLAKYVESYSLIRQLKALADQAAVLAGRHPSPPLPAVRVLDPETGEMILIEDLHAKQDRRRAEAEKKKPKK